MKLTVRVVLSSLVMASLFCGVSQAGSAAAGDATETPLLLAAGPQVSPAGGAAPCGRDRDLDLAMALGDPEPIPAAPPWGCTFWGVCSNDCNVSCFYNQDCPHEEGERVVCLCDNLPPGSCP